MSVFVEFCTALTITLRKYPWEREGKAQRARRDGLCTLNSNCYLNSSATPVPVQPIANLGQLQLTAQAAGGPAGQDDSSTAGVAWSIEIGLLAFACIFGGAVLGLAVGRIIPESCQTTSGQCGFNHAPRLCRASPQPGRLRRPVDDHPFPRCFGSPFMSGMAILCSGQGYQGAGMFDLLAEAPEAGQVFKAAKFVLDGKDPRQLVREASSEDLHADKAGQILCCTQAMAAWAVLSAKIPRPLVIAGYSIGELAAMGCRGFAGL